MEVPAEGGAPHPLLEGDDAAWELVRIGVLSRRALDLARRAGRGRRPDACERGKAHVVLPTGFGHAWDGFGHLYFATMNQQGGTRLQVVDIDPDKGLVRGAPRTIGIVTGSLWELAVSADGHRLVAAEEEASRRLTRLPLDPGGGAPSGAEESLSSGRVTNSTPGLARRSAGRLLISDILGHTEVWILDLATRQRRRLQLPGEDVTQTGPAWMVDGRHMVCRV